MKQLQCFKYNHKWTPRKDNPVSCPKCKSRYWNFKGYTKCEICKRNFLRIILHHKDGNHSNNTKGNLIYICIDCHQAIHQGIGKAKQRIGIKGGKYKIRNYRLQKDKNTIVKIKLFQNRLVKHSKETYNKD